MNSILLLGLLAGRPLLPESYTACIVTDRQEADIIAREVQSVKDAKWCFVEVKDCSRANFLVYKSPEARETYVISETCR